ncbi:6-phosphogluconolactonase [Roseovarius nanhaiticus]|uniref:6-phosphogluconolactonase n=1 Tax=Roseovarius nanhaiticus TaxID=573024 RepID=A0A1N7GCS8_9RHOB|nr:6-phosphogluconolactonase [Roseovarius nanhaiticus]SEK30509.1 6-phosphogluconolactonase [Roseovarius nanhaiticus]SIS10374.1 6-phosphogluconolactonase [Roseovarius nanhaiticus]
MNLIDYPDTEFMAMGLADVIAAQLSAALRQRDRALLVVPGGTTPGPIFDTLCGARVEWDRIDVMPSDERWRPQAHLRSNAGQIAKRLLCERAATAALMPLYVEGISPEAAAPGLAADLAPHLPIDVALVGMGGDMHTASIFPRMPGIEAALAHDAPALLPVRIEGEPEPRITLAAHVLRSAMHLHVVIIGSEKREALERARNLDAAEAPIAALLDDATVHWAP